MARIRIDDLPVLADLTPEELEQTFGAGSHFVKLSLESLENRELLDASLQGSLLSIQDTKPGDTIHVRQMNGEISVDGIKIQTNSGNQASIATSAISQVQINTPMGHEQVRLGDVGHALTLPVSLFDAGSGDRLVTPTAPNGVNLASDTKTVVFGDGSILELDSSRAGSGLAFSGPDTQKLDTLVKIEN
jgi:hypothetical protein